MTPALLTLALVLLAAAGLVLRTQRQAARAREAERRALLASGVDVEEVHWRTTRLEFSRCDRCGVQAHTDVHGDVVGHEGCVGGGE